VTGPALVRGWPPPRPSGSRAILLLVALTAACATAGRTWTTPVNAPGLFLAGYHPYWAGDGWKAYPRGVLTELYFFELEAGADGRFLDRHGWPDEWAELVADATSGGLQVTPTISMHDADAFESLFRDPAATDRMVDNTVSLLRDTEGLSGLQLDFEVFQPVDSDARDGFTDFVARVSARMEALDPALSLSVFTLAFDDDDVYDEQALAGLADYLVVQGYDYHSMGSDSAGPVAPATGWGRLSWEGVIDRFLDLGISPRRIVMSVPLYGYEWPVESDEPGSPTRGAGVAAPYTAPADVLPELPRAKAQAARHGSVRDEESGSPYYVYRDDTGWWQGWFDDAESLRQKYDLARARGLGALALFPAAYADEDICAGLRELRARGR